MIKSNLGAHGGALLLSLALTGCSIFQEKTPQDIDCNSPLASCHSGRFGLTWQTETPVGREGDSLSGIYRWRSLTPSLNGSTPLAYFEVDSALGPNIGVATRQGDFYEVRAADGRVYLAQDWQTLFDLMFPVSLPADALIKWMESPRPDNLPELPKGWTWEKKGKRYSIRFKEENTQGRIDLIPNAFE